MPRAEIVHNDYSAGKERSLQPEVWSGDFLYDPCISSGNGKIFRDGENMEFGSAVCRETGLAVGPKDAVHVYLSSSLGARIEYADQKRMAGKVDWDPEGDSEKLYIWRETGGL